MRVPRIMVVAGEASGDSLAAELVVALRDELQSGPRPEAHLQPLRTTLAPRFFGAGGTKMQEAGVEVLFDLTAHSVIGIAAVVRRYWVYKRLFARLLRLALDRQPDLIVCVDFSGFNRRFARAIRARSVRSPRAVEPKGVRSANWFSAWAPKIVQYVSPQVWASREGRVRQISRDYDLLLSIFPFEKHWYAERAPGFPVEFVGHPMLDRHAPPVLKPVRTIADGSPSILLLPGSREAELRRHVPVMIRGLAMIRATFPELRARMVLPSSSLAQQARAHGLPSHLEVRVGGLADCLAEADLAIASTGTVTMECAYFRVPTVALYKTSWPEFEVGKRIVKVKHLAMPNLLAGEEVYPEFIQHQATAEHLSHASIDLLRDVDRRRRIRSKLDEIVKSLGAPGASRRAARLAAGLLR